MTVYSFDTSALIGAWDRYYAIDVFPVFWTRLEEAFNDGTIICTDEVKLELEKKNDDLTQWCADRVTYIELEADVQRATSRVLEHPAAQKLTNSVAGRNKADPWVIGLALARKAKVVTDEHSAKSKIRIPDVCEVFSVPCLSLIKFMRDEKWTFSR